MKAIVLRQFGGPEVLQLEEVPDPVAGDGDVVVRVHAVSVNRTLDLVVREGRYVQPVTLPHILGVDPSGVIVAVGPGVTERKVGDRVACLPWRAGPSGPLACVGLQRPGGYAEYVALPASATALLPDALDFVTATLVVRHGPQAFYLLRQRAALKAGETVLVLGASGGLGSAGVQVAGRLGARVIAAAGSDARMRTALALGAAEGIDYGTQDLAGEVLRLTQGRGVDVVFDNIGRPDLFAAAVQSLARHGRLVTAGSHGGGEVPLDVKRLYLYQLSILGGLGSGPADLQDSLQAAVEGRLRIAMDRVLPLREAAQAHRRVAERSGIGKIVLDPTAA